MKSTSSKRGEGKGTGAASRQGTATSGAHNGVSAVVTEKIKKEAAKYNPQTRKIYLRAMTGASRKDAMTAFCCSCMGYNPNEVKECTAPTCPLFPYRMKR